MNTDATTGRGFTGKFDRVRWLWTVFHHLDMLCRSSARLARRVAGYTASSYPA